MSPDTPKGSTSRVARKVVLETFQQENDEKDDEDEQQDPGDSHATLASTTFAVAWSYLPVTGRPAIF
jgi:hypothetical protein